MKTIQRALKKKMQLWGMNGPYHLGVLKISGRMKASLVIVYEIKTNHKSKTQLFIPKTDSKGEKKKTTLLISLQRGQ